MSLRSFSGRVLIGVVTSCALASVTAQPAGAIDIVLRTLDTTTHPNLATFSAENPAFDPDGSLLAALAAHAATVYEDAFRDAGVSIEVTYWWDTSSGVTAGQSIPSRIVEAGGHVTHAAMRFSPNVQANLGVPWYIDTTPTNDSEFDLSQVLYNFGPNTLTAGQRTARFTGVVPGVFEAGFNGPALPGAPANAQNGIDLLTVVFQELGHSLGMNAGFSGVTNANGTGEADDGDFDVPPGYVHGATMAMLVRGGSQDPLDHLVGSDAVMGSLASRSRTRPSTADLIAIAQTSNFDVLNLPRKDFLAGNSLNTGANWLGARLPDSTDTVYIRHGNDGNGPTMSANLFARDLFVTDGTWIHTGANKLDVTATATIERAIPSGGTSRVASVDVGAGGELEAATLNVNDGGRLALTGGLVDVNALNLAAGSDMFGFGTIDVATLFVNNGRVSAAINGTLVFNSADTVVLNLDGTSPDAPGELEAVLGNLEFNSGLTDTFNGRLTVGVDRSATFNHGLLAGSNSVVTLDGSATAATLAGTTVEFLNNSTLNVDGLAVISAQPTFRSGADITVPNNGRLRLTGVTTYNGGNFTGAGSLEQNANATVTGDTTINVATLDMDGASGNTAWTLNPGVRLTINSTQLDSTASDGFDGTLNVNSGELTINTGWRLDDTLNLTNVGGDSPTISGSGVFTIHTTGVVNVTAGALIQDTPTTVAGRINLPGPGGALGVLSVYAPMQFSSTAVVDIDAGSRLVLNHGGTFAGGSYVGNGLIVLNGNNTIVANTTFGTAEFDWDGLVEISTTTVNEGRTLSIVSNHIEPIANDGYDGFLTNLGGTVSVLAGWRLDNSLTMNAGPGAQSLLTGAGPFRAHQGSQIVNDGAAVINAPMTLAGLLHVRSGNSRIAGGLTVESTARMRVASSLTVTTPWTLPAGAELQLEGPAAGGTTVSQGNLTVHGRVSGSGGFNMPLFVNRGDVFVGAPLGEIDFVNYQQDVAGDLWLELGGTQQGQTYDTVDVQTQAQLNGLLHVSLANGFVPEPGTVFTLMEYGNRVGEFESALLPNQPLGLGWTLAYTATRVTLTATGLLPGDIDLDGDVDRDDVAQFLPHLGTGAGSVWTHGDFNHDRRTTLADLALQQAHLGQFVPNPGPSPTAPNALVQTVPEPTSALLAILAVAATLALRRRSRILAHDLRG